MQHALSRFAWRARWLSHPLLLGCALVLAVNDHYLKARHPGWWTGKLSDVAGVAVIAIVASVVAGRRTGLLLTAAGFLLLKSAPGVAENARPILGGVTARDPSDILALIVLLPLERRLRSMDLPGTGVRGARMRRLGSLVSRVGLVVGLIVVVGSVTATSCGPDPAVVEVVGVEGTLFARVDRGWGAERWAQSVDGGNTWGGGAAPPGRPASPPTGDTGQDAGSIGATEVCLPDGTCIRLVDRRAIESRAPGAEWTQEFRLSEEAFERISTGCVGGQRGVLASVAATQTAGGPDVVASLGADGVLMRGADGEWRKRSVPN